MAITFVNSATGNAATFNNVTVTCPATQAGDLLICEIYERNASGATPSGLGLTWNVVTLTGTDAHMSWAIATGDHSGGTVTAAAGTGGSASLTVYRGVFNADPLKAATLVAESNSSGNETQAQITTLYDGAMVCLAVCNTGNGAVSSQSCTSPGGLTERTDVNDAASGNARISHASAIKTTAGATGSFTWAQANSSGVSWAYALMPNPWPITVAGNQPAPSGALADKFLKALAGAQAAPSGALADITVIPGGVTLTGAQAAPSGTVASLRYKALAGAQAAPSGALTAKTANKFLAGSQPAASGALAVKRVLSHFTLAGAQAAPSGALASLKTKFAALAGNQPAASGSLAADVKLRHVSLAGNQPNGTGALPAVVLSHLLSGAQAAPSGALVGLVTSKHLAGAQPAGSGALALEWVFRQITLSGAQPAATGDVAALAMAFVDLAGNQPAAAGALVAMWGNKYLAGNQPNATGALALLVYKLLQGDQPAGSGEVTAIVPLKNVGFAPAAGRAHIAAPLGAGGAVLQRLGAGRARGDKPPGWGGGRLAP